MKNPHAAALGKLGGKVKSAAKTRTARKNGAKGGRPKKDKQEAEAMSEPTNKEALINDFVRHYFAELERDAERFRKLEAAIGEPYKNPDMVQAWCEYSPDSPVWDGRPITSELGRFADSLPPLTATNRPTAG